MDNGFDDTLSDVLRMIRLKGCVYFMRDFAPPWGMDVPASSVAQFHMIARGRCWLKWDTHERQLCAGDAVVFPNGDAHTLADQLTSPAVSGSDVMQAIQNGEPIFTGDGGAEDNVRILCGHFEFDREVGHPLITELPRALHVEGLGRREPGWLDSLTPMLVGETNSGRPGADTVVDRLAEVLLIQILRNHLLDSAQPRGFLAAMTDQRINLALKVIHTEADGGLTLENIARKAGMSRSSFATRFKELMGIPPIIYLTQWRMMKARDLLKSKKFPISEVAEMSGYTSEAAFSRAFKRQYRQSPSAFRGTTAAVH